MSNSYNHFNDVMQDKVDLYIEEYLTRDSVDLTQFIEITTEDPAFVQEEILPRLSKSIINCWDLSQTKNKSKNLFEIAAHLFEVFADLSDSDDFVVPLMDMLTDQYFNMPSESIQQNVIKHRNVCLILNVVLERYQNLFPESTRKQVIHYLVKLINDSSNNETVLYSLHLVGQFFCCNFCCDQITEKLTDKLQILSKFIEHTRVSSLYSTEFDFIRYQVGFCARWFVDHLLGDKKRSSVVKLSLDKLSVRVDKLLFPTVRSKFAVVQSSYCCYYEAILVTDGSMRIGWTTREGEFNDWNGLGADKCSIGLDGAKGCVYHDGIEYPLGSSFQHWKVGDVLGCLIDPVIREFKFYVNGNQVPVDMKINWQNDQAYYAAVSLTAHQQVDFNFGQSAFKYRPAGVDFKDFYLSSNGDGRKFRLLEPNFVGNNLDQRFYWFKEKIVNNHVERAFQDEKQKEFDQWIRDLNLGFDANQETIADLFNQGNQASSRLIQSIVEFLDGSEESKLSIITNSLSKCLSLIDPSKLLPNPSKLIELLYPYMQLCPDCHCEEGVTKHQNICLILAIVTQFYGKTRKRSLIQLEQISEYLEKTILNSCGDRSRILFSLICLQNLKTFAPKILDKIKVPESDGTDDFIQNQINLLINSNLNVPNSIFPELNERLNPQDRTKHLTISSDLLSIRNDNLKPQSIRSTFPVLSGLFYYETILETSGPMQIGWATKAADLSQGMCQDAYSIGFDGFTGTIVHNQQVFKLKNQNEFKWNVGDVIGCLIDVNEKLFQFYLNGKLVPELENLLTIYFPSNQPYFAWATLGQYQQIHFNFGGSKFAYFPPKEYSSIQTFHQSVINFTNDNLCPFCQNNQKASARLGFCKHNWKACSDCYAKLLYRCPTCHRIDRRKQALVSDMQNSLVTKPLKKIRLHYHYLDRHPKCVLNYREL